MAQTRYNGVRTIKTWNWTVTQKLKLHSFLNTIPGEDKIQIHPNSVLSLYGVIVIRCFLSKLPRLIFGTELSKSMMNFIVDAVADASENNVFKTWIEITDSFTYVSTIKPAKILLLFKVTKYIALRFFILYFLLF